ncbi:mitochondrial import inner membrane translocase subunit Tim29 [Corythoichthys intestinalis]|uniref:mitochondrial import inner membrane translocase subunit Tim29 n=1 Tax=Corythoichthys intestinalis TaxID=161448 RepID=UPI0025A63753|nr:mitochondrial import inner membrane translocase subunit Tim29 [Corythoichthys intestinalis]XP_061811714.1 mitochondrial import inner membrane translocase subunit Tim29-like [Nerophis lumbriciformis]
MALRLVTRRILCVGGDTSIASRSKSYWEKVKNSKAVTWSRSLLSDYKEACREMVVGIWERPIKASLYMTILGGALTCFSSKPDYSSFEAALLERANQLGLLSSWIRNATSDSHVQSLLKLRNEGRLLHVNLGLISLIYFTDHSPDTALYEAQCSSVAKLWREFPRCVMDVGFVGRWWILDSKMKNYDINEDEFLHLPVHMKVSSPPTVQVVESNEQLHKESWLPLKLDAEEK